MPLKSMTGFARAEGAYNSLRWHWELRSVNGRGLDLRFRLPPGYDALEPQLRLAAAERLKRGNVTISLMLDTALRGRVDIRLNEAALRQVFAALAEARMVAKEMGLAAGWDEGAPVDLGAVLALKGVLDFAEADAEEKEAEARTAALLESFGGALAGLDHTREAEGTRLGAVLAEKIDEIAELVDEAEAEPSRRPEAITARLAETLGRLSAAATTLDSDRLHQEAVLIAAKADIEEELKRLHAHVAAARTLLSGAEPAGRKLDFLVQEFHREANTLCSKASAIELTRIGLKLKAAIDQIREQVQNIE